MLFFITLAILSLPTGKIATKFGNYPSILTSLLMITIFLQLLTFIPSWLIIAIICGSLSLVLNSVIPFIIGLVPLTRVGLGIGTYFGGFGAGLSFFDLIFPKIDLNQGMSGSAIALVCATMTLQLSQKLSSHQGQDSLI
jgi:MFS family permease